MNGDYISREAAIDVVNGIDSNFARYIEEIPAADVEPVIRCKDCRYSYIFEPWECDATRYCKELKNHWGNTPLCVNDDDYCSHAERR